MTKIKTFHPPPYKSASKIKNNTLKTVKMKGKLNYGKQFYESRWSYERTSNLKNHTHTS